MAFRYNLGKADKEFVKETKDITFKVMKDLNKRHDKVTGKKRNVLKELGIDRV